MFRLKFTPHLKFSYVVWLVATRKVWKPERPPTNQKKMKQMTHSATAAGLAAARGRGRAGLGGGVMAADVRVAARRPVRRQQPRQASCLPEATQLQNMTCAAVLAPRRTQHLEDVGRAPARGGPQLRGLHPEGPEADGKGPHDVNGGAVDEKQEGAIVALTVRRQGGCGGGGGRCCVRLCTVACVSRLTVPNQPLAALPTQPPAVAVAAATRTPCQWSCPPRGSGDRSARCSCRSRCSGARAAAGKSGTCRCNGSVRGRARRAVTRGGLL